MSEMEMKIAQAIGFDRVRSMTPNYVNQRLDREMEGELQYLTAQGREAMQRRVVELEYEWNIDQALMANFAVVAFAGMMAGALHSRKWLWAPAVQLGFLFLHASKGWCPPTALFRRLGFRSQKEIEIQRQILKSHLHTEATGENINQRPDAA
jgi:hypothetical protein